jgi:hypothetical protein
MTHEEKLGMAQRDWRGFQTLTKEYIEGKLGVTLVPEFSVQLDDGQRHRLAQPFLARGRGGMAAFAGHI